jgi:hypothetical protein
MVRPFIEDPAANKMLHDATPWGELGKAEDVAKVRNTILKTACMYHFPLEVC